MFRSKLRIPSPPSMRTVPSLTSGRAWVVQEGSVLFISRLLLAVDSSGAGFYSGPLYSSILVAGHLGGFATCGPDDLAGHARLKCLTIRLLAGDRDLSPGTGDGDLGFLAVRQLQLHLG